MQELVGRLTALDPEASETLKVVSYFDTLVGGSVGPEALVRGAAVLSGAVAGYRSGGRVIRVSHDGVRMADAAADDPTWPSHDVGPDADVWIERVGAPHANDTMVVERLAIAMAITLARRAPAAEGAVEVAVSSAATAEERAVALSRLRLDATPLVRAVALPADSIAAPEGPSSIVATAHGLARAVLVRDAPTLAPGIRAGIGLPVAPEHLPESWSSALIALRLGSADEPVVDATELGAVLLVAEAAEGRAHRHPDAAALAELDPRSLETLDALADTGSVRAAAARLGMHHSSVQARVAGLATTLGYDPRTPRGRTRYALARALLSLGGPELG
ncbi:helix-turn-helix domain-containing protein [Agromyces albus]|uniref:PucR family transcriptional regulator n=1 Tax=Agromyces albus TaxID=205332 RepID=A0A4Q2L476_9MICO|nr:LysR family transcriptional regulator [Agromyces albus]RXZ71660.1 PucR family transcriptional regulator [Agromyces albus]